MLNGNSSELRVKEQLTASLEGVQVLGAPGAEEGSQRHLALCAMHRAGTAADLAADYQGPQAPFGRVVVRWRVRLSHEDKQFDKQFLDKAFDASAEFALNRHTGIRVSAMREGIHVAFSVADDGRGLSPELLPMLFRKFARFESDDPEHGVGGSGLGLAICRGIVEAHGGRIRAESAGPGLGARFTFTLPVADGAGGIPRAGSAWTLSPSRGENRTRVLVVDDDPQTLRHVRDALSSAGYACTVTGDPEQVDFLLEREKPHLVLLDLLLPGTDGIGLMERFPRLSRVPVIFLSAYGRDQIIAQALEAGADDYIVKPFSPTELVARIQTVLRRRDIPATAEPAEPFVLGELTIDYGERRVSLSGRSIHLTDKEYRLLYELSVNAGRVVPHDHLLQALWGPGHPGHPGPVRTVVKNLRWRWLSQRFPKAKVGCTFKWR